MNGDAIRELERESIRAFVASCAEHLTGRTLDFGAGRQPYQDLVSGPYVAYDRASFPGSTTLGEDLGEEHPLRQDWDAILCTQVIQYLPHPDEFVYSIWDALTVRSGHLILTGPTNWPEVEPADLHRFTRAGIRALLEEAGFEIHRCESRLQIDDSAGFELSLGYAILASA